MTPSVNHKFLLAEKEKQWGHYAAGTGYIYIISPKPIDESSLYYKGSLIRWYRDVLYVGLSSVYSAIK